MKDVLQTQVNVQCGLWRGRVHFTMAADSLEEVNSSTKGIHQLDQAFSHTGYDAFTTALPDWGCDQGKSAENSTVKQCKKQC